MCNALSTVSSQFTLTIIRAFSVESRLQIAEQSIARRVLSAHRRTNGSVAVFLALFVVEAIRLRPKCTCVLLPFLRHLNLPRLISTIAQSYRALRLNGNKSDVFSLRSKRAKMPLTKLNCSQSSPSSRLFRWRALSSASCRLLQQSSVSRRLLQRNFACFCQAKTSQRQLFHRRWHGARQRVATVRLGDRREST